MTRDDRSLRALTAEINYHEFFLRFVLLPFLGLLIPTLTLAVYAFGVVWENISHWFFNSNLGSAPVYTLCLIYFVAFALLAAYARCAKPEQIRLKQLHDMLSGGSMSPQLPHPRPIQSDDVRGALDEAVKTLWQRFEINTEPPSVYYFRAHSKIDAFAMADGPRPSLCVSEPILDRDRGDPLTTLILAHELSHIVFADVSRIARLYRSLTLYVFFARAAFLPLVVLWAVWLLMTSVHDVWSMIVIPETKGGLGGPVAALMACVIVVLPAPLSYVGTMRFAGYIFSLLELRADVSAAIVTGDREHFARTIYNPRALGHLRRLIGWFKDAGMIVSLRFSHFAPRDRAAYIASQSGLVLPKFKYLAFFIFIPLLVSLNPVQFAYPQIFWVFCAQQVACGMLIVVAVLHACRTASSAEIHLTFRSRIVLSLWLLLAYLLPVMSIQLLGVILVDIAKVISIWGIEYPSWSSIAEYSRSLAESWIVSALRYLLNGDALLGIASGCIVVSILSRPSGMLVRSSVIYFALVAVALCAYLFAFWMTYPFPEDIDLRKYILGVKPKELFRPWSALLPTSVLLGYLVLALSGKIWEPLRRRLLGRSANDEAAARLDRE